MAGQPPAAGYASELPEELPSHPQPGSSPLALSQFQADCQLLQQEPGLNRRKITLKLSLELSNISHKSSIWQGRHPSCTDADCVSCSLTEVLSCPVISWRFHRSDSTRGFSWGFRAGVGRKIPPATGTPCGAATSHFRLFRSLPDSAMPAFANQVRARSVGTWPLSIHGPRSSRVFY